MTPETALYGADMASLTRAARRALRDAISTLRATCACCEGDADTSVDDAELDVRLCGDVIAGTLVLTHHIGPVDYDTHRSDVCAAATVGARGNGNDVEWTAEQMARDILDALASIDD